MVADPHSLACLSVPDFTWQTLIEKWLEQQKGKRLSIFFLQVFPKVLGKGVSGVMTFVESKAARTLENFSSHSHI